MKKIFCFLLPLWCFVVTLSACPCMVQADKIPARNFIIRTNRVIGHAQMSVKRGGKQTGDLAKAVMHERVAKKLFLEGNYLKAVHHSRRARILAVQAIKANNVKPPLEASFTPVEQQLFEQIPADTDLDSEADTMEPATLKDNDLMNGNLDLDLKADGSY